MVKPKCVKKTKLSAARQRWEYHRRNVILTLIKAMCMVFGVSQHILQLVNFFSIQEYYVLFVKRTRSEPYVKFLKPELRNVHGTSGFLYEMLSGYPGKEVTFLRMTTPMVNHLVNQIKDKLKPVREHKACISVEDRITGILRFLATGYNLRHLEFQTRMSQTALGFYIPKV